MFYGGLRIAIGETGETRMDQTPKLTPREKTVLLVDDGASIRAIVSRDLKDHYNVLIAGSGLEALRRSREFAGEIHLSVDGLPIERHGRYRARNSDCRPATRN